MSQAERILLALKDGQRITSKESRELFGCERLAARIKDLRLKGHDIRTETVRTHEGKNFARYFLVPVARQKSLF